MKRVLVENPERYYAVATLYYGHLDNLGPVRGRIIMDVLNPPWRHLYDIPWSCIDLELYKIDPDAFIAFLRRNNDS